MSDALRTREELDREMFRAPIRTMLGRRRWVWIVADWLSRRAKP